MLFMSQLTQPRFYRDHHNLEIQKTFQILIVTGNFDGCQSFEIPTLIAAPQGMFLIHFQEPKTHSIQNNQTNEFNCSIQNRSKKMMDTTQAPVFYLGNRKNPK